MEYIPEKIRQHVVGWRLSQIEQETLLKELNAYFKLRKERIEREKNTKGDNHEN